jgi:diacylglycerol kinase
MDKLKRSFRFAKSGLKTVWQEERNFRIETAIGVIVVLFGIIDDLSSIEWMFVFIAIAMVLGAEILNTAVEDICNKIEPAENPIIGKIKDTMAGFVLLSCIVSVLIGLIVFF